MSEVSADLNIELNVECPHCTDLFDLMGNDIPDLNDEGHISKQCVPSGDWSEPHKEFDEKLKCPHCQKEVHIKGINW